MAFVPTYVNWCGHGQEVSPLLLAYGRFSTRTSLNLEATSRPQRDTGM